MWQSYIKLRGYKTAVSFFSILYSDKKSNAVTYDFLEQRFTKNSKGLFNQHYSILRIR